jgi:hypothetical protein
MKNKIILFLLIGALAFFVTPSWASETGEIKGQVTDESGEGLPGVAITAKSPNMQGIRTIFSHTNGMFYFPLLPVGKYSLSFKLDGFSPVVQENVTVRLGHLTEVKVAMPQSVIDEEITVIAPDPLLDKTSTDTSYHLSHEDMEKMPVQNRTIVDAVKFAPGVSGVRANTRRGNATEGQPSFRGEGEEGNNWIVDGISISGVRLKNSGVRLNFDSLEEIQIISDPFSPEFGSAYGGIINMVTKSGSNDYSGEFSLVFMDKNLQAERLEQLAVVTEPEYYSHYNWYLNFGGPIIKDKLWFFISNNLFDDLEETRDTFVDYLMVPGGEKRILVNNLFSKLTYAFDSNHTLSLTSIFQKSLREQGGTGIPDLYEKVDFSDIILRFNYKGIINTTTFIEAGLGHVSRENLREPIDQDLGPAMYYIEDLGRNVHNSYGTVIDDQKRTDLNFKLIKHWDTDKLGHHEVHVGIEYFSVSSKFAVNFSGQNEDLFPDNGFDNGTKYYFSTWMDNGQSPLSMYEFGVFDFINSSRGFGLFFKDKFNIGRFTIMAGLRSQTQVCLDNNGDKMWFWGLDDFLSPRLFLSYDITGDGKNILKIGWGKFSDLITTMPLGLLNSGAGLKFRTYLWQGPGQPDESTLHNPDNWKFDIENDQQFLIEPTLKPNFLTRYLIEYDRMLGKNWAFMARFVHTMATDLLEVLILFDPVTAYKFLYDNFEHKRRTYTGMEFELNGKIGSRFFLNASYAYASAKGTNPGQSETGSWTQDEGSTNYLGLFGNHPWIPALPGYEDLKEKWDYQLQGLGGRGVGDEGWFGKLPYSIDHNIKINAIYLAPWNLSFSAAFEYISGYYWEKLGYVPFFKGYYSFPEGRGTRKTPGHTYLDLGVEKTFSFYNLGFFRSLHLTVRFDLLNIFNSQQPLSYVKENTLIFGQIWGRQQPRQARMTIKVKW